MRLRAYLVSGEFQVHRADCRDCEIEARRSDSPGDAGEYASRAEAIASLWPDIISGDPARYAAPGAIARLGAGTAVFLPCTSGLPGTSPATGLADTGSHPGDEEELAAWAAELGLEPEDLEDLVHDAFSRQASETNNDGLESQVRFLVEYYGPGRTRSLLSDLQPRTATRASADGTAVPPAGAERCSPAARGE